MVIKSKEVVYLGSLFENSDMRLRGDRHIIWRMRKIPRQHRSKDWKKEQLYKLLTEFDGKDFKKMIELVSNQLEYIENTIIQRRYVYSKC